MPEASDSRGQVPGPRDHYSSQYGGDESGDAWHAQPPIPEVVYSAHDGHKGPVVDEGQCRTQNDRREYVCAVNDPQASTDVAMSTWPSAVTSCSRYLRG
jgi:hypothetical protein